ncbi:Ig-like domain-containing protein [Granulicella sp. dw_53]|uniref:Ig-like domain-containing protein n=1 Tax=Granulicella sp. dw_53 TaxID=2719792 RepID=UPI001BD1E616|nr:Ig-like domain-containing protein [Granulicella sp. dw_53]
MSDMRCTRILGLPLILVFCLSFASPKLVLGQDDQPVRRGRKYKAPPETSHIEVLVTKKSNGKPISNAAVVFNPSKDGKDIGSLEVKTDPEGKATIDVIPTGSTVRVQIIANGYATFAEDYVVAEPNRQIAVAMLRPQEQISAYEENHGKSSGRKAGVQEPVKPTSPATSAKPGTTAAPTAPATMTPTPQASPAAPPQ